MSGESAVFCGSAPLALWMYLGHILQNMPNEPSQHIVVNFRRGSLTGQAFFLRPVGDKVSDNTIMTLTPPKDADGRVNLAMLYVSVTGVNVLTADQETQVRNLFPKNTVGFWRLQPMAGNITINDKNLDHCREHIRDALGQIRDSGFTELVLATSAVDAVAFSMGELATISTFYNILFLDLVRGVYQ